MKKLTKITLCTLLFLSTVVPLINVPAKPAAVTVVISTGVQTTTALSDMVKDYNDNEAAAGVTIKLEESTWETQNQHDTYVTKLAAKDSSIDIISMDVIWPPEFTEAGWLEQIDDLFEGTGYTADLYLEAPILAGTYQGHHYGLPWFHDSAMLFYRADILKYAFDNDVITVTPPTGQDYRAPETWKELHDWTLAMLDDEDLVSYFNGTDGILNGFVWQGREYEGMICDFMEYLGGTGQTSFLVNDEPAFNTTDARAALTYMKSLIDDGVSPEAVLTYQEETSRAVWNAGNAIFHRNWPYCYRLSSDNTFLNGSQGTYLNSSLNSQKAFGVVPMPHKAGVTDYRTSCLGGWQLGLNVYSEHKDEAKLFMKWLTDVDQQKYYLLHGGQIPTREAVYSDSDVLASDQAYVHELLPVFKAALPRPVHPDYPAMSKALWPPMHTYLAGGMTLNEATAKMDAAVNDILSAGAPSAGIPELAILALFSFAALVIIRRKRKLE
ncbi:MAG: ABC transporter substrate-binding protein [Candidatus Thorarchaeota archaeon]